MHTFEIIITVALIFLIVLFSLIPFVFISNRFIDIQVDKVDKSKKLRKKPVYSFVKRIMDITFSSIFLILTGPLLLVCIVLIKLDSPGPAVFFRQCIGFKGKLVRYRLFRTLRLDFEVENVSQWSTLSDPRITRVGSFLRKTALDYLPIFVDVFLGKLSFVGLSRLIPYGYAEEHLKLFDYAKPGLLGLGMTNVRHINYEERELLDFAYVQSQGFLTDMKICLFAIRNTFIGTTRYTIPQKKDSSTLHTDK